jgi:hypothetical protein
MDASNHGHVKLLPILIRYVLVDIDADKTENDSCVQIKTRLIHFVEITGETAEILSQSALQAIRKLGLENKVIDISGDNTNTNFGELKRKGTNSVFCKIKEDLNRGVTGLWCVAHMIHNCAYSSINTIPLDIEGLVVKIFGYFHIFTARVEWLKEFCDCWATV